MFLLLFIFFIYREKSNEFFSGIKFSDPILYNSMSVLYIGNKKSFWLYLQSFESVFSPLIVNSQGSVPIYFFTSDFIAPNNLPPYPQYISQHGGDFIEDLNDYIVTKSSRNNKIYILDYKNKKILDEFIFFQRNEQGNKVNLLSDFNKCAIVAKKDKNII